MSNKKRSSKSAPTDQGDDITLERTNDSFTAQKLLLDSQLGFARIDLMTVKLVGIDAQRQIDNNHVALLKADMSQNGIRDADTDRLQAIWYGFEGGDLFAPAPPVIGSPEPLRDTLIGVFSGQHRIHAAIELAHEGKLGDAASPPFWSINLYSQSLLDSLGSSSFAAVVASDNVERDNKAQKFLMLSDIIMDVFKAEDPEKYIGTLRDLTVQNKRCITALITDRNCFLAMQEMERALPGLVTTVSASRGRELFGWHFGKLWQHIASEVVSLAQELGQTSVAGSSLDLHEADPPEEIPDVPHTHGPNGSWCIKYWPTKYWITTSLSPRCVATANLISAFEALVLSIKEADKDVGKQAGKDVGKQARTDVKHLFEFVVGQRAHTLYDKFVYNCWMLTERAADKRFTFVSVENFMEKLVSTPELYAALKVHPREKERDAAIARVEARLQEIASIRARNTSSMVSFGTVAPVIVGNKTKNSTGNQGQNATKNLQPNKTSQRNGGRSRSASPSDSRTTNPEPTKKSKQQPERTKKPMPHLTKGLEPESLRPTRSNNSSQHGSLADASRKRASAAEKSRVDALESSESSESSDEEGEIPAKKGTERQKPVETRGGPQVLVGDSEDSSNNMDIDDFLEESIRTPTGRDVRRGSTVATSLPFATPWRAPSSEESRLYGTWVTQIVALFEMCPASQRAAMLSKATAQLRELQAEFLPPSKPLESSRKRRRGSQSPPPKESKRGRADDSGPIDSPKPLVMNEEQWIDILTHIGSEHSLIVIGGGVSTYAGVKTFTAAEYDALVLRAFQDDDDDCRRVIWSCAKEVLQARTMPRGHLHALLGPLLDRGLSHVISTNFDGLEDIPDGLLPAVYRANPEWQAACAKVLSSSRLHCLHGDIAKVHCFDCDAEETLTIDNVDAYIDGTAAACTNCAGSKYPSFWHPAIRFVDEKKNNKRVQAAEHRPTTKDQESLVAESQPEYRKIYARQSDAITEFTNVFIIGSQIPNPVLYEDLKAHVKRVNGRVYVVDRECSNRVQRIGRPVFIRMDSEIFAKNICQRMLE